MLPSSSTTSPASADPAGYPRELNWDVVTADHGAARARARRGLRPTAPSVDVP